MQRRSDWNHYVYTYGEGTEARVEFDVEAAVMPGDDTHGLRIVVAATQEGALHEVLASVEALWVGRLVYADRCELVLQVASTFSLAGLQDQLDALDATVQRTNGWDYFNDRVCPTPADWRRIQDRETLERLDLDGDGELRVLHRFYGDDADLERVEARLLPEGFEQVSRDAQRMTLAHVHPIGDISRITLGLQRLCERAGVAYDGWALPG